MNVTCDHVFVPPLQGLNLFWGGVAQGVAGLSCPGAFSAARTWQDIHHWLDDFNPFGIAGHSTENSGELKMMVIPNSP
jgi:hypothetical protein